MPVRFVYFILLVSVLSSCSKVVTISIPNEADKVVLNALMNKDSTIVARVTLSARVSERSVMPEITDAVVKLYENGNYIETMAPYKSGNNSPTYYHSTTKVVAGNTYKVTAAAPNRKEVSGSDVIPDTATVGEIKMTVGGKTTVTLQLHDDPAVKNYYRVRMFQITEWMGNNGLMQRGISRVYFETEETTLSVFNDSYQPEFYTTDALFNGRSPRFIFRANTNGPVQKMVVELTTLTSSSYNYLNSTFAAKNRNEDGFAEKVIVFNNIENGLGIVGGMVQMNYIVEP